MSAFTIDRLRAKINSYIELFNRIRKEEGDPDGTSDARILETLRPLIFIHWSKILHQVPETEWKDVCIEIAKIDKARDKAKNAAKLQEKKMALQIQEEIDHKMAMALAAEMNKADTTAEEALAAAAELVDYFTMDADQRADLLMFEDAERPDSPCIRHANPLSILLDDEDF